MTHDSEAAGARQPRRGAATVTLPPEVRRQLAAYGARFVLWRWAERDGRRTKVPLRTDGRNASSTDPTAWATLEACDAALAAGAVRADGLGFVLAAERDRAAGLPAVVGVDLDGCRDPATGALEERCGAWVRDLASYAEVSPSGTGVKALFLADPAPSLAAHKRLLAKAANGHAKDLALEVYATGRYFTVTGDHLDGTPDELCDATEAAARLAAFVAEGRRDEGASMAPLPSADGPPSDATMRLVTAKPKLKALWGGAKTKGDTSASGMDWSLAWELGWHGVAPEEVARALKAYPHGQLGQGTADGRRLAMLLKEAERAAEERREKERKKELKRAENEAEAVEAKAGDAGRARIRLAEESVNDAARECAGLLADTVYMRGSLPAVLVRVEELPGATAALDDEAEPGVVLDGVRHARGSLVFAQPSPERLQYRLDDLALFEKYDGRSREWTKKSCPTALARRVIGAAAELGFRPCAGIVTVPLFVRGRVVAGRGYHAPTGLLLDSGDAPPVPEHPDRGQARRACRVMLKPFRGYLGGLPRDQRRRLRAAVLAAVLTAVLRPSLPAAPAVLLDANVPGAGKGKMARALAAIATDHYPAIITEGHDSTETEKRLAAAVLGGSPCLLLDNLQRLLASSTLESGLTEGVASIRVFGTLTTVTVPCSALVLITANNAALRADMLRRALPVRIVADTETPELRRFDFDPYAEARRLRPAIVAAALAVARAWWLARDTDEGRRIRETTLGSFEQWAEQVAGAVEWLTGVNPVALIEERKAEDPRRGDERALVAELRRVFGPAEWRAGDAAAGVDPDTWAELVRFKGERPTGREVGGWLRARRDRVFGRLALHCRHDTVENVTLWRVEQLDPGPEASTKNRPASGPMKLPAHTGTYRDIIPVPSAKCHEMDSGNLRGGWEIRPGMSRYVPVGHGSTPGPTPAAKGRKGRKGALPLPGDLEAWRALLRDTLPGGRTALVREWARCLGGSVDDAGRVTRLPALEPGPVRDALLAALGRYRVEVAS